MENALLVRAPNWLGDAVMCGPFLKRLAVTHPNAPIDVLCRPALADVFKGFPGLREVLILPKREPQGPLIQTLQNRRYSVGYALPPSFSSALLLWRLGIPQRVGFATDFRSPLLTQAIPLDERFHYVRRYLQLLGEPGKEINAADFYFPRAADKDVHALFSQGQTDARRLLAVAPGSRADARRWFPERFADVLNGLDSSWTGIVLLGAPEDVPFANQVADRVKKPLINLCGKTSLPLAAAVLERCAALLTNESGLMHVGWAVGTPLVVVAGPSESHATSPFGPHVRIIQHREIPCVPCVKNTCYRFGEEENLCLKMISSAEVLTALTRPLHGKPIPDRER